MEIPYQDRSNYLKGLLIVAKIDRQLANQEKEIIREIGEKLGFASDFYEDILKTLLANQYILNDPIKFSNKTIAQSFIEDGLKLAFSDDRITDSEVDWLRETALANDLDNEWFENTLKEFDISSGIPLNHENFAIYSILQV